MRVFVIAAMGAALMAGCAPFEHGHYSQDVSYRNTAGDPPGTPLVYWGDTSKRSTSFAAKKSWKQHGHNHATAQRYGSYGEPLAYSSPVSYPAPIASQPVTVAAAPISYSTPTTYAEPVSYSAPVQQVAYAPPVHQHYVEPAGHSTYSGNVPIYQSTAVATTYGGGKPLRFDAEGYAICDIPHTPHAAHHAPHYTPNYSPRRF